MLYARAVLAKRWDARILRNKIHIPLLVLGSLFSLILISEYYGALESLYVYALAY